MKLVDFLPVSSEIGPKKGLKINNSNIRSSSAYLIATVKYTFCKTKIHVTGMAQWLKCPGRDDFVNQPNRVNHAIPMQFGVVVVFAILPNTMSWLHPKSRDKMSGLGVKDTE